MKYITETIIHTFTQNVSDWDDTCGSTPLIRILFAILGPGLVTSWPFPLRDISTSCVATDSWLRKELCTCGHPPSYTQIDEIL